MFVYGIFLTNKTPNVYFGTLTQINGELVFRSAMCCGELNQFLKQEYYGRQNEHPYLLVKGISEYAGFASGTNRKKYSLIAVSGDIKGLESGKGYAGLRRLKFPCECCIVPRKIYGWKENNAVPGCDKYLLSQIKKVASDNAGFFDVIQFWSDENNKLHVWNYDSSMDNLNVLDEIVQEQSHAILR